MAVVTGTGSLNPACPCCGSCAQTACECCTGGTRPTSYFVFGNAPITDTHGISWDGSSLQLGTDTNSGCGMTSLLSLGGFGPGEASLFNTAPDCAGWFFGLSTGSPSTPPIYFPLPGFDCCSTDQTISVTPDPSTTGPYTSWPTELRFTSCGCPPPPPPGFAAAPVTLDRPDRCEHLLARTEFRSGCAGMNCRHGCKLDLPAVPGGYCQTCDQYQPDEGVSWLS